MMELTKAERELLDRITLNEIQNGNSVNPKPYNLAPEEYILLHKIRIKLDLNERIR